MTTFISPDEISEASERIKRDWNRLEDYIRVKNAQNEKTEETQMTERLKKASTHRERVVLTILGTLTGTLFIAAAHYFSNKSK